MVSRSLLTSLLWLAALTASILADPIHVYLTWQDDPSTTMTVNFQTRSPDLPEISLVYFDTEARGGDPGSYSRVARGRPRQIPGLPDQRWIHAVELTHLRQDTTYYFIAGNVEGGFSTERKFRTLPDGREPIRFVTGGDMGVGDRANRLLKWAGQQDPHFGLIGGDIAYVNGDLRLFGTWDRWLDAWENYMVTRDGCMIPMFLAIGNHECNDIEGPPEARAPFFYGYFAQGGRPYFSRRIGSNAVILALDSGHTIPHDGAQAEWLEQELRKHQRIPFKFAVYHVPLYPSHRSFDGDFSRRGRQHWGPLFDAFQLTAAFENHDHTFKRSKLLRHGQVDPAGTLYLGDGCFGRDARTVDPEIRWYLEKQGSVAHFWRVDISEGGVVYQAIDEHGRIFDVALTTANE